MKAYASGPVSRGYVLPLSCGASYVILVSVSVGSLSRAGLLPLLLATDLACDEGLRAQPHSEAFHGCFDRVVRFSG